MQNNYTDGCDPTAPQLGHPCIYCSNKKQRGGSLPCSACVWLSTNEATLQHVIVTQQERILELEQEVCDARVVSTPPYDDTPTFQVTHLHYETDGENSSWRGNCNRWHR